MKIHQDREGEVYGAIDTLRAGDVFHGAYLAGLARARDLGRIATFASAVSAIHCTVSGTRKGIPSVEEVETFIRECT